jgi:hypothetical protein
VRIRDDVNRTGKSRSDAQALASDLPPPWQYAYRLAITSAPSKYEMRSDQSSESWENFDPFEQIVPLGLK